MSPENDSNLHPTVDAPSQTPAERVSSLASAAASVYPDGSGAATAVARAPEPPETVETESPSPDAATSNQPPVAEASLPEPSVTEPVADSSASEAAVAEPAASDSSENETMDQLMDQFSTPQPAVGEGEIFDGHVLAVTDAGVVVDVGGKFEGLVPAQEFLDSGTPIEFGPGQTIEVERLHEQKDGYVLLSHTRAHRRRVWERIEKSYRDHSNVKGKVTERIKGGLVVEIGVRAFLPASQIELRPVHDLEGWKGKELELRVLKLNRKRGNVVVSRRSILEEEQQAKRDSLASTLAEGTVVTGRVKNVTDYGVFVDLGGMDGLLHVSDLVWGRVPHPSSVV
jgi:small subunit ribosomal protein S1